MVRSCVERIIRKTLRNLLRKNELRGMVVPERIHFNEVGGFIDELLGAGGQVYYSAEGELPKDEETLRQQKELLEKLRQLADEIKETPTDTDVKVLYDELRQKGFPQFSDVVERLFGNICNTLRSMLNRLTTAKLYDLGLDVWEQYMNLKKIDIFLKLLGILDAFFKGIPRESLFKGTLYVVMSSIESTLDSLLFATFRETLINGIRVIYNKLLALHTLCGGKFPIEGENIFVSGIGDLPVERVWWFGYCLLALVGERFRDGRAIGVLFCDAVRTLSPILWGQDEWEIDNMGVRGFARTDDQGFFVTLRVLETLYRAVLFASPHGLHIYADREEGYVKITNFTEKFECYLVKDNRILLPPKDAIEAVREWERKKAFGDFWTRELR